MLTLITGPSKSGKSRLAEAMMEQNCPNPLYIGTLPRDPDTSARIEAHRGTRGSHWSLYEATQEWPCVLASLESLCKAHQGVLIDGIASMLWIQVKVYGAGTTAVTSHCRDLTQWVERYRDFRYLVVVDCDCPFPDEGPDFWFNVAMRDTHTQLRRKADSDRVLSPKGKAQ